MRIALLSDIHGNVPALEAVLEDIGRRGVNLTVCLGDIVGKGPEPDAAVDLVRRSCAIVVQGNWDDKIFGETQSAKKRWQQRKLGKERLDYLKKLPFSYDFFISGQHIRCFHASPYGIYKRIFSDDPLQVRLQQFDNTGLTGTPGNGDKPDIVVYGDLHEAFIQPLEGRLLVNTGSMGNPHDENAFSSYILIEGEDSATVSSPYSIQMLRVPYDVEESARRAIAADLPGKERYLEEIRTGKYLPHLAK